MNKSLYWLCEQVAQTHSHACRHKHTLTHGGACIKEATELEAISDMVGWLDEEDVRKRPEGLGAVGRPTEPHTEHRASMAGVGGGWPSFGIHSSGSWRSGALPAVT